MASHALTYTPSTPNTLIGTDGEGNYYQGDVNEDGLLASRSYIWNTVALAWEAASGSTTGGNTVTVNNFPATQPVSGPLTEAELRTSPIDVSGPLTDAELRAEPVPVSGTVTASGPLTNTELRAVAVPVSGSFYPATQPISAATLETLVDTLHELAQRLSPLGGSISMVGGQALRVSYGGGTFATSGPQTSAEFIASYHIGGRNWPYAVALHNMAAQANINNVTAV